MATFTKLAGGRLSVSAAALIMAMPALAHAQAAGEAPSSTAVQEIVVTAQKREASINTVPQTVSAVTGTQLIRAGVTETRDLVKLVPSFIYSTNAYGNPVFSIRGVGLQDESLQAAPTVSLYLDEAPLPYALLSHVADFDLDRVEVLKGPQGTLFGSNSTGGAVGYIAAKPTQQFSAGVDLSYGRFNAFTGSGFVSGPITDTLSARLAISAQEGGDWQHSYTRDAHLGASRREFARLLLDWHPTDKFKLALNLTAGNDDSDTQAARFISVFPASPFLAVLPSALVHYPLPPSDPGAADWSKGEVLQRNDHQYFASANALYELSPTIALKGIAEFQDYTTKPVADTDGTNLHVQEFADNGHVQAEYGELRLQSQGNGPVKWVVGGNYEHDIVNESATIDFSDSHFTALKAILDQEFGVTVPGLPLTHARTITDSDNRTYAVYADAVWSIIPSFDIEGGIRYTDTDKKFFGCTLDTGDGAVAGLVDFLYNLNPPIPPGTCTSISFVNGAPVAQFGRIDFDQNNVSWKTGVTWRFAPGRMIYANISQGYKAGSFPNLGASLNSQFTPANQESLLAYEVGTKLSLLDHRAQLNGAVFYYDYADKQVLGRIVDPVNGPLPLLINIPKSRVIGVEIEGTLIPISGLTLHAAATYVNSEILSSFSTPDEFGDVVQLRGLPFPNSPDWSVVADVRYQRPINEQLSAFVGASLLYESATNGSIGDNPLFRMPSYTTIDLQAGISSSNDKWRFTVWGRNVTNTLYYTSSTYYVDALVAFAGMPATYGVSLSYRY